MTTIDDMEDEKDNKQSRHKVRTEDASAYDDKAEETHRPEQFEEQIDDGQGALRFPKKKENKQPSEPKVENSK